MDLKWYHRLPLVPAWLKFALLVYALWLLVLYLKQDRLIFFPKLAGEPAAGPPYAGAETLTTPFADGSVYGYFIPAPGSGHAPLVVLWHGNAELIDGQVLLVDGYRARGFAILLPEYPGYGHCSGKPSQTSIVATSLKLIEQALAQPGVDPQRVLFHGRSLGGAVAAQVALQRTPHAVILQSTPANIARMAHGYGAPAGLVRHPFATDEAVPRLDLPLLVIHGRSDAVIPFAQGRYLASLSPRARLVELPAGHNDLPPDGLEDDYWQSVDGFLGEAKLTGNL